MNRPISSQTTTVESLTAKDTSQSCPIDQNTLDGIRALENEGASNLLNELIDIYLNESQKLLQDLEKAIIRTDAAVLEKAAHSLKSISGHMGAFSLAALCKELETMGRVKRMEGAAGVLSKTVNEYERVVAALKIEFQQE